MKALRSMTTLATLAALFGGGCGSAGTDSFGPTNGGGPSASSGTATGSVGGIGAGSGSSSGAGGTPALPPETKTEGNYQTPVSTRNVVWVANPTSGRVAYINAQTFDVQTVEAGNGPTYLAAISDPVDDVAIVQNVLSQNATLLRVHPGSIAPPTATLFPSTSDANSWAVSQSGRWAIAWTDATRVSSPDPTQGFQAVAVIDTSRDSSVARPPTILSVGFRPVKVAFSGDDHAFAVTQDGITVIDLLGGSQPVVTQNYPLVAGVPPAPVADAGAGPDGAADSSIDAHGDAAIDANADSSSPGSVIAVGSSPTAAGTVPDVSFAADGTYALARTDGVASINVISLKDGSSTPVLLPAVPTDLTVSPDGTFAIAVLRDTSTVAVLPLPGIAAHPDAFLPVQVPGQTIGRAIVTKVGTVLLFTTVAPIDQLTVLTLKPTPTFFTATLHAPVLAVFPTDDGNNAVVLHNLSLSAGQNGAGSGAAGGLPAAGAKGAFSLVPISKPLRATIESLPAPAISVALSPASDRALVTFRDDSTGIFGMDMAMLPSFVFQRYPLASPPIAVGITAGAADAGASQGARGYVAQDYADGRITFVDLASGSQRTLTGFELGARIVEGPEGGTGQ
jgi:hypothetical protein